MPSKPSFVVGYLLLITSLLGAPLARAQSAQFDLPPQPLAESLRAVASATHTNILFDASVVEGIQAPALKGTRTPEQAVATLLAQSKLRYVRVDAHTIRIARAADAQTRARQLDSGNPAPSENSTPSSGPSPSGKSGSAANAGAVELSEVIVTGSHIHGASTPSPTITLTRQDIDRSGYVDVGEVVRSLPENFSAGNNPQVFVANTPTQGNSNPSGGSSPNLRGLGPSSTLTLVNGHRLGEDAPSGSVDISLIPLAAVERIDVVTDSSSAAYGSDAVAGVVNIVLRKDYDGVQTSGTLGKATDGGGYERDVSQLLGHSWSSGGALAVYEHERQDAVWSSQRDFTQTAASPTTLLPEASRDSGFLSVHQDVGAQVSFFGDVLYTARESNNEATLPAVLHIGTFMQNLSVRQYLTDVGMTATAPGEWKVSAYGSDAEQHTVTNTVNLAPGASAPMPIGPQQVYLGAMRVAELSADGPIWNFRSDSVRAAIGGGYRDEYLADSAVALRVSRGVRYAFSELSIPLAAVPELDAFRRLDLNMSGRYESYTDLGSKIVPKIGVLVSPTSSVELRATWSEAFRAPTLSNMYDPSLVYAYILPDPLSPTHSSVDLIRLGGNPALTAETARTWTAGIAWQPEWLRGARAELSYYDIQYRDRVQSLSNVAPALSDPANAPLVTRNPSAALQQAIIAAATGGFINESGQPYDPANIAAIVDARDLNLAEQRASGADLLASYRSSLRASSLYAFINGSYMELRQRLTPAAPDVELVGRTFNPPRFRARGGLTWARGSWSTTTIANWTAGSVNTYLPTTPSVGSWTTFDAQISFTAPATSGFAGLKASLSVQNILDRDPPFVQFFGGGATGLNYDSNNVNPIGRYVSFQISKEWFPRRATE